MKQTSTAKWQKYKLYELFKMSNFSQVDPYIGDKRSIRSLTRKMRNTQFWVCNFSYLSSMVTWFIWIQLVEKNGPAKGLIYFSFCVIFYDLTQNNLNNFWFLDMWMAALYTKKTILMDAAQSISEELIWYFHRKMLPFCRRYFSVGMSCIEIVVF